jgi:hypothetical protein
MDDDAHGYSVPLTKKLQCTLMRRVRVHGGGGGDGEMGTRHWPVAGDGGGGGDRRGAGGEES